MANNSFFNHLKNTILLPGTVTVLIPYLLYVYLNPFEITDEHMLLLIAGILFVCCGVLLLFRSIFLFSSKGKGTLAPWNPTRKLVISGLYSHVRNPMILGVLCILIGEALYFNSISILVWAMVFFIINSIYFEFIEEPKLERKFGDAYLDYKENVSRWIPSLKPYQNKN